MSSHKAYLTKSSEVARRIAQSFRGEGHTDDIESVSYGYANKNNERIPAIYGDAGYHYCIVSLKESEPAAPTYELTIC